jgi:cytoskeletal protein CcmA (bactofilin family)
MSSGKSIFTKGESKPSIVSEEVSAFLGRDSSFEGKITFQGVFRLEGKFDGEIFEGGTLIVGETATVKGKVGVQAIIINGHVEGEIQADGRVEIHSTGKFFGNLSTPIITISEGGIFEGQCKMDRALDKKEGLHLLSQQKDYPLAT